MKNSSKIYNISDKVVFVTGAGKGIGRALIDSLLSKNVYVFALTKSRQDLKDVKNKSNIKIFYGDVSNAKLIKRIFKLFEKNKKFIKFVVNNAGIRQRKKFENIDNKSIQKIFKTNFFLLFEIIKIFSKFSLKHKLKSSIVNIGSIVGENGFSQLAGYSSTKGALKKFNQIFCS